MNEPSAKQKKEMWLYISLLVLLILAMWGYFLKIELRQSAGTVKESNKSVGGLGGVLQQFVGSASRGAALLKNWQENFKLPTSATTTNINQELINKLKDKLEQKTATTT
ncbi:MAG: hypothetical protein NTZ18_02130 [Candidatus Komeilibacteria bacterium]|nr:hypothetical protein [Candidatus Komeilibacteria bacterium]